jgi:ERCC4-related helicase
MDENTQLFPSSQSNGMDTDYFKHDVITRKLKQLKRFIQRANIIYEELGRWALDYFIRESLDSLRNGNDIKFNFGQKWQDIRAELLQLLESHILPLLERRSSSEMMVSCKVQQLVEFLTNKDENECSGLVFVQQRATVAVLTALLSQHPATRYRFKCATFVGFSNSGNRRYDMDQLLDLKIQQKTLAEFRARKKNLVIATDVLEEGIDVTACNLVICFDPPKNLKSFIQRRGRARQERSEYVIMCSQNDTKIDQWESLEQEMIERYQDDQRGVQHLRTKEEFEEENDDIIEVKSTG